MDGKQRIWLTDSLRTSRNMKEMKPVKHWLLPVRRDNFIRNANDRVWEITPGFFMRRRQGQGCKEIQIFAVAFGLHTC